MYLPLYPIWFIDTAGCIAMTLLSILCLCRARRLQQKYPGDALAVYLLWFTIAIFAFSLSRSLGHLLKHLLLISGHQDIWQKISPVSGSINSITFVFIASATLFFHHMEHIITKMQRDKERIKKTSKALLDLNREIESLTARRSHAELAMMLAHEVRNPIMIIGGLLKRLRKRLTPFFAQDPSLEKKYLSTIMIQIENLENMVQRFERNIGHSTEMTMPQEMNKIVERTVAMMNIEAEAKEIDILVQQDKTESLCFYGNPRHMEFALTHLLRNAIQVADRGEQIRISLFSTNNSLEMSVEDSGPGIPEEIIRQIKSTVHNETLPGSGLGLNLVKQIVTEHKGNLEIERMNPRGTRITISIPRIPCENMKV